MRVTVDVFRVQTHLVEQFLDAVPLPALEIEFFPVDQQRLGDDVTDRHPRVERSVRILEDDLDIASQPSHLFAGFDDAARHLDGAFGRRLKLDEQPAQSRLTAARLTHDAEGFALTEFERDGVDGLHVPDDSARHASSDGVVLLQIRGLEDDFITGPDRPLRFTH